MKSEWAKNLQAGNILMRGLAKYGAVNHPLLSFKIMRVIIFFSGNATAFRWILSYSIYLNKTYKIVGAFTDRKDAPGIQAFEKAGIKLKYLDHRDWSGTHGIKTINRKTRKDYFTEVSQIIKPFRAHVILCSGFMLVITDPLLTLYKYRILNVHPADLRILDKTGKRKYVGRNAVARVIADGQKEICSTVHVVNQKIDDGPIITTSTPLYINPGNDPVKIQERMKYDLDGYICDRALDFLARGKIKLWDILALGD